MSAEKIWIDGKVFTANQLLVNKGGRIFRLLGKNEQKKLEAENGWFSVNARVIDTFTGFYWEFGKASGITNTDTIFPLS